MTERRRYPRYNMALEVEYNARNDVEIQSKTYTYNVSEGGISIPLNKAIKPKEKIAITLRLPYGYRQISAIGKVAWKKPCEIPLASEQTAGIEFLDMDPESKVALVDYIREKNHN